MLTVSTGFKTAMQSPVKRVRSRIVLADGTEFSGDQLESIKLQATGDILSTSMTQLDVVLLGEHDDLVDKVFTAYYGVRRGSDYDYVPLGVFNVLSAEYSKDEGNTKLTTYDNMVLFQKPYAPVSDFPTTLQDFTAALCAGVGVRLTSSSIYNGLLDIPEDYYALMPEITYRDVLKQICEVSISNARMTADGALELVPLDNPTGEVLTYDNLMEYKLGDKWGSVNSVVLSRQPQNDDIFRRDEEDISFPTTKNILDLNKFNVTYSQGS